MNPALTVVAFMVLVVASCWAAGTEGAERDYRRARRSYAERAKRAELEQDSDYYGRTPR